MKVKLETTQGDITVALDTAKAPKTVENFVKYVEKGFYNGTLFHRVIDGFMIQGGGFDTNMTQKPVDATIDNEASNGLRNLSGTIAMARTDQPHSASSQFFINVADSEFLDFREENSEGWGYCVFGKVEEGMDVVNAIKGVATTTKNGMQDVPVDDVIINNASVLDG